MEEVKFQHKNGNGDILRARLLLPDAQPKKRPIVIMLTGDGPKGSNSLSWTNMPTRLMKYNIASLLFDFSGLGNSEGSRKQLTLTKGIEDFKVIYSELHKISFIDWDNVGIMASSFGASVALTCTEIVNQCKVLGLKSPCCFLPDAYVNEIGIEYLEEWQSAGYLDKNGYDISVLQDPFKYNIYEAAGKITIPCLITHGTSDEVVPFSQSLYLKNLLGGDVKFNAFEGGDHGYTGENWEKMASVFEAYFKKHLTPK